MSSFVAHALLGIALVVGYVTLTITGHDGSPLLFFLGGQAAGVMIEKKTKDTPLP